jgi:signal transduction histidine kinase
LWSLYWSLEHSWIVAVVHDITARKETERLQAGIIAMVSHDLRAPLATVQMFLQGLDAGVWGELPKQLRATGAKSKLLLDRLISLSDDILSFEKIEDGDDSLDMHELEIAKVIEDATHAVSAMAAQSRVFINTPNTTSQVFGSHNRLVQVLTNLLTNAIKYSPAEEAVSILVSEDDSDLTVQVWDKGPGISDQNKNLIFEKFKQVQSSKTKSGTGLGLAICKQIIEHHGGRIGVSDAPYGGSIFWFRIPKQAKPVS